MADVNTLIHVRFAVDGSVTAIGELPVALSPQQWFDYLSENAGPSYQPFAGGRGMFRIEPGQLDALKNTVAP